MYRCRRRAAIAVYSGMLSTNSRHTYCRHKRYFLIRRNFFFIFDLRPRPSRRYAEKFARKNRRLVFSCSFVRVFEKSSRYVLRCRYTVVFPTRRDDPTDKTRLNGRNDLFVLFFVRVFRRPAGFVKYAIRMINIIFVTFFLLLYFFYTRVYHFFFFPSRKISIFVTIVTDTS